MKLTIPKGTTFDAVVVLESYEYQSGDIMRFGVKSYDLSGDLLISKTLEYDSSQGGFPLSLLPSDTAGLNIGTYLYDIGLQTAGGDYYIPVECDEFVLQRAVTQAVVNE